MLISPTEPPALKAIGRVSLLPERWGCDLMFASRGGFIGIQRKEFKDLLASMQDGRLAQQLKMMNGLALALFVIEGMEAADWQDDGQLMSRYHSVTKDQIRSLLYSVRERGMWVEYSTDLSDTIAVVKAFEAWEKKEGHRALDVRPGPVSMWGKADNRDWQMHLLQGLPGIGIEMAGRVLDELGMPLCWSVTREELLAVPGLGPKKVDKALAAVPLRGDN